MCVCVIALQQVFEQWQAALQELRRALGLAVRIELSVKLEDFAQVIELHMPQEINQYMEELKHTSQSAGYH
jgi:hypothetical protein